MKTALNIVMLILISVGIIMAIAQILFYLGSLMFYPPWTWPMYSHYFGRCRIISEKQMIRANELRIGNWYKWYAEGKYYEYQVEAIDLIQNYENFEPISLTEEWLFKFGFNHGQIELSYPDKLLIISAIISEKYYFYLQDSDGSTFCLNYIEYAHQLQNLYFALTGNELTIK